MPLKIYSWILIRRNLTHYPFNQNLSQKLKASLFLFVSLFQAALVWHRNKLSVCSRPLSFSFVCYVVIFTAERVRRCTRSLNILLTFARLPVGFLPRHAALKIQNLNMVVGVDYKHQFQTWLLVLTSCKIEDQQQSNNCTVFLTIDRVTRMYTKKLTVLSSEFVTKRSAFK